MKIRKTYRNVKPELLFDELKDLISKQGVTVGEAKLETYALPTDSSSFISRGTQTFLRPLDSGKKGKECARLHIVGSSGGETKVMIDIEENLFNATELESFQEDLDFMLGSYEVKQVEKS